MKRASKLYLEAVIVLGVFFVLLYVMFPHFLRAQNINTPDHFPDPRFRRAKEKRMKIETGGVFTAAHLAAIQKFDCGDERIRDLTGIEYFTGLTLLECSDNSLSQLDLSGNPFLEHLDCDQNGIKSLNLSNNLNLNHLECSHNLIDRFDLSNNAELRSFVCRYNRLESLDLSGNPNLESLLCDHNMIDRLDVSHNPKIIYLSVTNNQLTRLPIFPDSHSFKSCDLRDNPLDPQGLRELEALAKRLGPPQFRSSSWLTSGVAPYPEPVKKSIQSPAQ